jgi:hypothetical protein
VQSWGWLGGEKHPQRRYVRRIVLRRPDEEDLILITDLFEAEAIPAVDLLGLYQERWGIERMFQKVTEVFGLEGLIGSTPKACIFQFAFCLLLYNLVQLLTNYVALAKGCEAQKISSEKLFEDVREQLIAWNLIFTVDQTFGWFGRCPGVEELRRDLEERLSGVWSERWWKAKEQGKRRKTERKGKRGHSSVFRILQAHAQKKSKAQINQTTI